MNKAKLLSPLIIGLSILVSPPVCAQDDMEGSHDHPEIPRIDGATIRGYMASDYDEGKFILDFKDKELETHTAGGKRTRIVYLVDPSVTPAAIMRNYQVALDRLGEVEQKYRCDEQCASNLGREFIWASNNQVPVNFNGGSFMYAPIGYRNQIYTYWEVTSESARYHVSVYSAYLTGIQANQVSNTRSIHLDIVEEADFAPSLKVVSPDEITQGITDKGRIALYGIHFEFDSDALSNESDPALEAISAALTDNPDMSIYIVGHTDDQGAYDYNLDLSARRAASVVSALTQSFGVSADRLTAVGVGPVAPVASNRSEEGQALNRRVELVER